LGVVQVVVSKRQIAKVLGDDHSKIIAIACLLGAASSSCSYTAVAIARALFRKGANFTAPWHLNSVRRISSPNWASSWPSCSAGSSL
jgi:uncharacterized membrane protein YraQ (UPF0718 family)